MVYSQALKFTGKRVYVILDDTSIVYGILDQVKGVTARILLQDNQHILSHIKHVYPC